MWQNEEQLHLLSQQGNARAECMLGILYERESNSTEALRYFKSSAKRGYPRGQFEYGCFLYLEYEAEEGLAWMKKGFDAGDKYVKGRCYYRGWVHEQDFEQAAHWFLEAAREGDIDAQKQIGYLYYSGRGVEKDMAAALKWFEVAGERGEIAAQYWCGRILAAGSGNVARNLTQAWYWYKKAAARGVDDAKIELENAIFSKMELYEKVRDSIMCLLCIRKFHPNDCGMLGVLPMDVVVLIGKVIWSWRDEYETDCVEQSVHVKRVKLNIKE